MCGNISVSPKVTLRFHQKRICLVLIFLAIVTKSNASFDNLNMPCKYLDSINITDGVKNSDSGTIEFEGISYPKDLYAYFDYEFTNESYRQPVASHVRGCTCKLKPCVRMCCPRGQQLILSGGRRKCSSHDAPLNLSVNVTDGNNNYAEENLFENFHYVVGRPCRRLIMLEPDSYKELDSWVLREDGSILKGDPHMETLNKNEYCLSAEMHNAAVTPTLFICFNSPDSTKDLWMLCGMFISVPFLLVTIIVYISFPELRTVYGKSIVCYLCGLTVGYTSLGLVKLNGSAHVEAVLCRVVGYVTYFAFLSAFFWLNVISYDIWRNVSGMGTTRNFNDTYKFAWYSLYAWGSTMIMVTFCLTMDASSLVPSRYKSGIGIDSCFLGKSQWSEFLYFYLPIIFIMSSNLTFFVLTYWKIRRAQKDLAKTIDKFESKVHRKSLADGSEKWHLLLRLFVIMGVTWTMEAISFVVSVDSWYFHVSDLINTMQGVLMFSLFVLFRANARQLVAQRWKIFRCTVQPTTMATTSSTLEQDQSHDDFNEIELRK